MRSNGCFGTFNLKKFFYHPTMVADIFKKCKAPLLPSSSRTQVVRHDAYFSVRDILPAYNIGML